MSHHENPEVEDGMGFAGHAPEPTERPLRRAALPTPNTGEREPVAWRIKDFADGWILCDTEAFARHLTKDTGELIQPLYVHPTPETTPATTERERVLESKMPEVIDADLWQLYLVENKDAPAMVAVALCELFERMHRQASEQRKESFHNGYSGGVEAAARVAEATGSSDYIRGNQFIADAIRALKSAPPGETK